MSGSPCSETTNSLSNVDAWPKRLIDIDDDAEDVRLVETEIIPKPIRYTCLSHYWGEAGVLNSAKTTRESLVAHLRRLDVQELSRTFHETIDFSRRMGFEYVWIDALCVVQGWRDD